MDAPPPVVRTAHSGDVAAICRFGTDVIPSHYAPLIGAAAAQEQVRDWWNRERISEAVGRGLIIVAEAEAEAGTEIEIVGVAQRGLAGADHVIYKLYVREDQRGSGLGSRLIDAVIGELPADVDRVHLEHFAANVRASDFYEREGFAVERIDPAPDGDPRRDIVWRVRFIPRPA